MNNVLPDLTLNEDSTSYSELHKIEDEINIHLEYVSKLKHKMNRCNDVCSQCPSNSQCRELATLHEDSANYLRELLHRRILDDDIDGGKYYASIR